MRNIPRASSSLSGNGSGNGNNNNSNNNSNQQQMPQQAQVNSSNTPVDMMNPLMPNQPINPEQLFAQQ